MYLEVDLLVSELLEHPVGHPPTIAQEVVLQDVLMDSVAMLRFFRMLAEQSPKHAEAILKQFSDQVNPNHLPGLEKLVAQYQEIHEARELNSLNHEELEARLTMLALLPSEAPDTQSMTRVLVRVLCQRDLKRAFKICRFSAERDTEFWYRLRRELFWAFRDSNPELALDILEEAYDGYRWLVVLLGEPANTEELWLTVLLRTLDLEKPAKRMTTLGDLIQQVSASKSPFCVALLNEITQQVAYIEPPERGTFLESLVRAARTLPSKEKRALLKAIRKNIVPKLPKGERVRALGQLLWESYF